MKAIRFHKNWRVAVVFAAFIAIGGGLAAWETFSTAESQGDGGLPQLPSQQYASKLVHYTLTEYTNYDVRGSTLPADVQAAQTKLLTERWVQLDAAGNQLRFKTISRLPSGEVWQERLFQDGIEVVNWYTYPVSGAECSQTSPHSEGPGSSLPFANDNQLASAGFKGTDRRSDLAEADAPAGTRSFEKKEPRSPVPGFSSGRSVIVRSAQQTSQRMADLFFGVDAAGNEVLLQSTTFSPLVIESGSPDQFFTIKSLPAGCGRPK